MRIVFGITVVVAVLVVLADANPAMDKGDNSVRVIIGKIFLLYDRFWIMLD